MPNSSPTNPFSLPGSDLNVSPTATPLVTVVTAIHNCELYVHEAVSSVISQSYSNWELMLVDDHSTDGSVQIAKSFVVQDPRISLIELTSNVGPAGARNVAIEQARGRYISFLDSDDYWRSDKLQKQVAMHATTGAAFSFSYYKKIDESGRYLGSVRPPRTLTYKQLLRSNQIGCLTAIYDTEQLGKVYMPRMRKRQDYGLWLRILRATDSAICVEEELATYRVRSSSVSSNKLSLLRYNWRLFRHQEKLSALKSAYYLGWNVVRSVLG